MATNQTKTATRSKSTAPAHKMPPAPKAAARRAASSAPPRKKRTGNAPIRSAHGAKVNAAQRAERIAVAAYFLAERRGFAPNHELDDWLAAERSL